MEFNLSDEEIEKLAKCHAAWPKTHAVMTDYIRLRRENERLNGRVKDLERESGLLIADRHANRDLLKAVRDEIESNLFTVALGQLTEMNADELCMASVNASIKAIRKLFEDADKAVKGGAE